MEVDEGCADAPSHPPGELRLKVESYRLRQFLAREIFKTFPFNSFKLDFNQSSEDFIVKKLTKESVYPLQINQKPEISQNQIENEINGLVEYEMGFSKIIEELI